MCKSHILIIQVQNFIEIHQNARSLFVLYCYENLRKVRTNSMDINSFKWRKYVLSRILRKVTKYAEEFDFRTGQQI